MKRNDRGVSSVELALVILPFLLSIFAYTEFSKLLVRQGVASFLADQAARFAAIDAAKQYPKSCTCPGTCNKASVGAQVASDLPNQPWYPVLTAKLPHPQVQVHLYFRGDPVNMPSGAPWPMAKVDVTIDSLCTLKMFCPSGPWTATSVVPIEGTKC